ncbi:MAG TPA: protein kinase [Thermoleophilaceae bacterium]|nr:protein kinase [Thermoleophilaceae bacterium]
MSTPQEVAGRYRVDRRLGAGGMSTVFLATDTVLERSVAIKLLAEHLAEDEAFVIRFRNEALAAARLQHPNVVQVFDSGEDDGSHRHYIVMEYVEGPSCADLLREHKLLDVEDSVRIVADACHGLDYAHRAGVVHRDVKPGNLLVANETGTTKLADFGIAKAAEQTRVTQVGSVLGTAAYLSPEQARGDEAGPASDIYSLGVCAYQFLAGRLPHEYGSLTELALKQQEEYVEPIGVHRPDVPHELDDAVRACLARDPASRYASALDMARSLEAGLQGEDTGATALLGSDEDATKALTGVTAATQAMRTGRTQAPATAAPRTAAPSRRREAKPAQRKRGRGSMAAILAILALAAIVIIALLSAGSETQVQPVDRDDVQQQIDGLRNLIQRNTGKVQ